MPWFRTRERSHCWAAAVRKHMTHWARRSMGTSCFFYGTDCEKLLYSGYPGEYIEIVTIRRKEHA
jgi:hypothetical protein